MTYAERIEISERINQWIADGGTEQDFWTQQMPEVQRWDRVCVQKLLKRDARFLMVWNGPLPPLNDNDRIEIAQQMRELQHNRTCDPRMGMAGESPAIVYESRRSAQ